jgi:uncharacterized protein YxeA
VEFSLMENNFYENELEETENLIIPKINKKRITIKDLITKLFQNSKSIINIIIFIIFLIICIIFTTQSEMEEQLNYTVSIDTPLSLELEKSPIIFLQISCVWTKQFKNTNLNNTNEPKLIIHYQNNNENIWKTLKNETLKLYNKNGNITDVKKEEFTFEMEKSLENSDFRILIETNLLSATSVSIKLIHQNIIFKYKILVSFFVFLISYSLIIFDVLERPLAGLVGVFLSLFALSLLKLRPSLEELIHYISWEVMILIGTHSIIETRVNDDRYDLNNNKSIRNHKVNRDI